MQCISEKLQWTLCRSRLVGFILNNCNVKHHVHLVVWKWLTITNSSA